MTAEQLMPKNEVFDKAMKLEAYDRMIENPFVDQEAITRDFLVEALAKGESAKYMKKQMEQILPQATGKPASPGSIVGQMTGRGSLAELVKA